MVGLSNSAAPSSAAFNPATGLLTIFGTNAADVLTLTVSSNVMLVNGGEIPVAGGLAATTNTVLVQILLLADLDQVKLSGWLPPAHISGNAGDDTLNGGTAADLLVDGPGNDFVDGNQRADLVLLGEGDGTFQWNPGDGNDMIEGQDGNDDLRFNGSNTTEIFDVAANGGRICSARPSVCCCSI